VSSIVETKNDLSRLELTVLETHAVIEMICNNEQNVLYIQNRPSKKNSKKLFALSKKGEGFLGRLKSDNWGFN
jgi:hypothetical protein